MIFCLKYRRLGKLVLLALKSHAPAALSGLSSAAEDHLVFRDLEALELFDLLDREAFPGNIDDFARFLINQMVVRGEHRVEDGAAFGENEWAQKACFNKQVQRVVNGGAGNHRESRTHARPDFVGRRVLACPQHVLCNG